jgi:hypothetical protein
VVDDTVRGTKMTGVTEYALPETDAGRVHLTVEGGSHTVYCVGWTSVELVSNYQVIPFYVFLLGTTARRAET